VTKELLLHHIGRGKCTGNRETSVQNLTCLKESVYRLRSWGGEGDGTAAPAPLPGGGHTGAFPPPPERRGGEVRPGLHHRCRHHATAGPHPGADLLHGSAAVHPRTTKIRLHMDPVGPALSYRWCVFSPPSIHRRHLFKFWVWCTCFERPQGGLALSRGS